MTTKHTPGPWKLETREEHLRAFPIASIARDAAFIIGTETHILAEIPAEDPDEEIAANARLMAAAPDLLDALRGLHKWAGYRIGNGRHDVPADLHRKMTEAIAKAEGGK